MASRFIFVVLLALLVAFACGEDVGDIWQQLARRIQWNNVSVESLVVTVQQQSAIITRLQTDLNEEKVKVANMKADWYFVKSKVASLPPRGTAVAFTAGFSVDDHDGEPIGYHATLLFDNVPYNAGDGYNPWTGIFTAPVAGTYGFFVVVMGVHGQNYVELRLTKNSEDLDIIFAHGNADQGSGLVTTHVAEGEMVWVRHAAGSAVRGKWYTYFTGFLIHAD